VLQNYHQPMLLRSQARGTFIVCALIRAPVAYLYFTQVHLCQQTSTAPFTSDIASSSGVQPQQQQQRHALWDKSITYIT